jgi:hypothetical protein
MEATQFDRVAKAVAQGPSRRGLVAGLLGAVLAGSQDRAAAAKRKRRHHKRRLKAQKRTATPGKGNSQTAKDCQKGGWATLARAEEATVPFATQDACVSYGAGGGTLVPVCVPVCAGKACGADDDCGTPCPTGPCSATNHICAAGTCVCPADGFLLVNGACFHRNISAVGCGPFFPSCNVSTGNLDGASPDDNVCARSTTTPCTSNADCPGGACQLLARQCRMPC